uniref:Uncharacterized protein n=1 Tax=Solanum tuberosum TaxID=4113 RepID=M1DD55_SOLTU
MGHEARRCMRYGARRKPRDTGRKSHESRGREARRCMQYGTRRKPRNTGGKSHESTQGMRRDDVYSTGRGISPEIRGHYGRKVYWFKFTKLLHEEQVRS